MLGFHRRAKAKTSLEDDDVPIDDTTTKTLFTPQENGRKDFFLGRFSRDAGHMLVIPRRVAVWNLWYWKVRQVKRRWSTVWFSSWQWGQVLAIDFSIKSEWWQVEGLMGIWRWNKLTSSRSMLRSRRLQGLQPELSTVLAFPARKKMEREENRPFCHRWRDPTVFSGERGEDSQRWLSDFQRVARYNKWDDSMCLANVIFYLTGTAKCWFENFEEILNSWEEFKIKFCEIFGNKEDTARKAENILRTRAQTSGENVESYIQEVLLLCKQSNPRMSEGEKVSHLIKGVAEEVYQALIGKDIGTVDQFVAFCRRFEAFKRMRVAPPRFSRLPNVTTISTAEPENLEALIRRIVREEVQKFMAPPSTFAAQDIDTPPPDLRDVIRSEIQQTLAPISAPRQPESFRPRRQYLPQNDQVYRRRTEGPPNNQRTQWRTEDDRPICFHCGRPGHVARYCRDRRQAFADARLGRETVDFGRPRTENYTMGESGSELSQGRFRNPSPYPPRGRFQAPRRTSQSPARRPSRSPSRRNENPPCPIAATMEKNWISVNIQGRNVQALVDSGADYSVISEAFRRSIKAPVFKENGPLLRAADKKPIVTLAEKSYEWKDLKLCAAMDCVIPPKSFGKIVVTNQDVFGSRDVVVTGSKRLQLEKGLFIPSSLVRFLHGRAVLWVTNSTHQSQVIPSDMKIGTMQDLEVGSISNLEACSEIAGKDEVTSPDVRECLISMISTDLEETKKNRLLTCLNEFSDIFDFEKKSFPVSGEIKHKIDTSDYPPVRQRPYRVSPAERRVIQSEVEKMMETKIIRPSSSPWASPVILVRKKDGSLRFCVDYRRLNKITKKDVYSLPRIDDALDTLSGSRYFSTMDMRSGYWQIEVDDKDREKTAFITPDGLYEFNVMPFGLCNAPATFERMIDNVLRGLKWDMCLCYLDDIVVYGSTFKEHLTRLYKCHFASRQITILGHVVNEFGTQPDPEKVKAIVHFPKPRNFSETRSFLGLSSYYRRFIKSYANKSRPLNSLLKKDEKFIWGEEQDESFRILKQELGSSPVLGHFIEGAETHVHTDASGYGLGAVLVQIQNDAERPIAYASRTLTKAEKNYSTTEKECLAVVWALGKFRPYLYGRPFTVVTDHHSLCWLVGLKDPSGRLARWALKLQEYDINIVYKSGRKHKDADCLSRSPLADTAEIEGHITSIQDIAEEQSKDPHLVGIREKLANENLKGYQMIGGVLYKKNYDPEGKPWLLVVPKQMRHKILKDVHDTPMAGHLGFAKTYGRVRKRFYWPGLYRTVSQYIAHCKECQRRKGVPQKPPGLLVPIPPTTSPFQKIGIDYLGRFPISHTGNRWIIVATDYLTRFAITKAAATAEATELATFLIEDVILKHGAPREIITDRGRNFMSQTIREINNLNGTIHRFTTAYHPQTNGLTERLNKTLTDMISMYVDLDQKNWDNILPYVTFAYNTARQETTGYSPFFLVHGREVETPLDSILPYQPAGTAEDYVCHLVTNAEDARMLARLNILQAQSKDKERYDKKHQEVTYKEGDLVWVFTPVRTVGLSEKLLKRYFGPYRVIRKISSVNYQVEGVTNTRRRRKTQDIVHVVRMKPYHDPEVQEQIAQGHVTD
ncbi:K02A2.6-like [Cordylochernes scorpioides]|uniref:RNA-directed DNA polymerase n=1 Tax=Cordylochernes scorpioides TaxID=51811 RepID=A0ABY6LAC3_9ARAC|nr:K02A2.6-like [Cordylochernes scorpioides]